MEPSGRPFTDTSGTVPVGNDGPFFPDPLSFPIQFTCDGRNGPTGKDRLTLLTAHRLMNVPISVDRNESLSVSTGRTRRFVRESVHTAYGLALFSVGFFRAGSVSLWNTKAPISVIALPPAVVVPEQLA